MPSLPYSCPPFIEFVVYTHSINFGILKISLQWEKIESILVYTTRYIHKVKWKSISKVILRLYWEATSVPRDLKHASQLTLGLRALPARSQSAWLLWPVLALLCNHLHIKGVRTVREGCQLHGNGGGEAEKVWTMVQGLTVNCCVTSITITCFLQMLPSSSPLPMFYVISFWAAQLRQDGVRKADGILLTPDEVI